MSLAVSFSRTRLDALPADRRRQLDRLRQELAPKQADWRCEQQRSRCPTGLEEVDALLGGGFPKGEVTALAGALGAGASTLVARALARATAAGDVCAWVDGEQSLSAPALAELGVDLSRVLWVRPAPAEAVWAAQLVARSGAFALIALDGADTAAETGAAYRLTDAVRAGGTALVLLSRDRPATASVKLRLEASVERGRPSIEEGTPGHAPPGPPRRQVRLWLERSPRGGEGSARVRLDFPRPPRDGFRPDPEAMRRLSERQPGLQAGALPLLQLARRLHTRPGGRGRDEALFRGMP